MNRNTQSHFAMTPSLDLKKLGLEGKRSKFNMPFKHKTTFNVGDVIPLMVTDVIPGDVFKQVEKKAIRMATPIGPVMDDLVFDTYTFFVPYRLVWEHFKEFMGENTTSKWEQTTEYTIPQINSPTGGWQVGTIANYMGIPAEVECTISALYFRAYGLICNNWLRDQNLSDPCYVNLDDATQTGSNGGTYQTDVQLGGLPFKAAKTHDYFTSALPDPQKGPEVLLPLGETAPVLGNGKSIGLNNGTDNMSIIGISDSYNEVAFSKNTYNTDIGTNGNFATFTGGSKAVGLTTNGAESGIIADLSNAVAASIIKVRQAEAIQRILERDAIGGTRYHEITKSHYGVTTPDAVVQIPEYLGGERIMINMDQVLQTSATNEITPQGNTAGYSFTVSVNNSYTKGFDEHGILMTVGVARVLSRSYQQGINRMFTKKHRLEMYWPELANIGMQEILNKEIFAQGTSEDDEVFGYQERYAEYKYKPNLITGYMQSNVSGNLDFMHYGDDFESLPVLGDTFIREPVAPVDRTIAVSSDLTHQFYGEFEFDIEATRTMPLFSNPSLLSYL